LAGSRGPDVPGEGQSLGTAPGTPHGTTQGAPDKAASGRAQIVIPFDDNRLLAQLLGQHDHNLSLLEQRLNIKANANGNVVTVSGAQADCELAKSVLTKLYARVKAGEVIAGGDLEGLIRHARSAPANEGMAQIRTRKKIVTARTVTQSSYIKALEKTDLVFGIGPAGTGKTYLAVAFAAAMLERKMIERIILSRPAVEAGERLGFLPGDMKEKVDPYLRPLYDALDDVLPPEKVARDIETGVIEIAPLAFMRGRTLSHACVILDEAQNTTPMQMKMFLTRLGEGSKMIITGDPSQIDLPNGMRSGLVEAVDLLDGVKGIEAIRFLGKDVVRRDIVARIVAAYDAADAKLLASRPVGSLPMKDQRPR
jgi:phosphate starvation-inducible protein PhoH and related proteins